MTQRSTEPSKNCGQTETVTCRHCRYERPAADARCHICGYPWPWVKSKEGARPKKAKS